ncbi:CoA transferase [Bradyrhizobium sp. 183]|uniref:CaiB/BaiF CoA transferase family protein n=1 Tax=unclassified Bradyrhizobium TaxID=2631580 RepID=UPI001FFFC1F3|nr:MULTISPECIES: CoA transferase [unclassified Bradyrhizobium]UPJ79350.1 CoA transferase [Bradyrhizobium sp. 184]UPJ87144.1 CoA transferase [Bradyrhizobium sp. 183]
MTDKALPLASLRIIDLSNVFSLPYATGLLSDLGAEVIKVEGHSRLDTTRGGAFAGVCPEDEPGEDPWNRASTFNLANRGKKSLAIDLRRPEGRAVLTDLIKVSDILMENFTPRVMRGWGLDYPNASKLRPGLIMASCTGYGQNGGPYSQYPAQATTQEATHGLTFVTGYRDGPPSKAGQSFVDFLACWALVNGTLLALRHRRRTGKGLWFDVAMYQLGCSMVSDRILDWEANRRFGTRIGNRHPWLAPQGCYRCAGDDEWCVVSVHDDHEWAALCGVIGRPWLAQDERFATNEARRVNHDEADAIISAWTVQFPKFEAMERLQAAGVRAGAVFDARDMHFNEHLRSRRLLEWVDYPPERKMGRRLLIGRPWKLSKQPLSIRSPAPKLGEHNREILQDILGYDEARCVALEESNVLATRPTARHPFSRMTMQERVAQGQLASWDPEYEAKLNALD